MGVGSGLYMYDVVVKRSRSLSHLLMSSCLHSDGLGAGHLGVSDGQCALSIAYTQVTSAKTITV